MSGPQTGNWRWHDQRQDPHDSRLDRYDLVFTKNRGRPDVKNGLIYLGYTHDLGWKKPDGNDRRAIPVGQIITATMRFPKKPEDGRARRAIAAAWWLLGHVGGLGSRSRRGFGTVALQNWTTDGERWDELDQLPIAHAAGTPQEWLETFHGGLKTIKRWYPTSPQCDHLVFGSSTQFFLIQDSFESGSEKVTIEDRASRRSVTKSVQMEAWERALNRAGRLMQDFRQRRPSDYANVRNHLAAQELKRRQQKDSTASLPTTPSVSPNRLSSPPDRSAFGLPLAFRYGSLEKAGYQRSQLTFQGQDHDRSASPIHIRIIQIGDKYYPFFARFDAPLLAKGEKVAIKPKSAPHIPIGIGTQKLLDDFCKAVLEPAAVKPGP